jgi:hypothetical protein
MIAVGNRRTAWRVLSSIEQKEGTQKNQLNKAAFQLIKKKLKRS